MSSLCILDEYSIEELRNAFEVSRLKSLRLKFRRARFVSGRNLIKCLSVSEQEKEITKNINFDFFGSKNSIKDEGTSAKGSNENLKKQIILTKNGLKLKALMTLITGWIQSQETGVSEKVVENAETLDEPAVISVKGSLEIENDNQADKGLYY